MRSLLLAAVAALAVHSVAAQAATADVATYPGPPDVDPGAPSPQVAGSGAAAEALLITLTDEKAANDAVAHMRSAAGSSNPSAFSLTRRYTSPGLRNILAVKAAPGVIASLRRTLGGQIQFIEVDATAFPMALGSSLGRDLAATNPCPVACESAAVRSWGVDRIDKAARALDGRYSYTSDMGSGVDVYVVDTGIRPTHGEIIGRVDTGVSYVADGTTIDCNGHGTHVATTAAGSTLGVARAARITPMRVFGCDGSGASYSTLIAAVDDVIRIAGARPGRRGVLSMSLGGPKSATMNAAVDRAVQANIPVVVAAGNNNGDACSYSPASAASALTVGATTNTDAKASYSNIGHCVDLFAPGTGITAGWYTADTATATISGTSMATPHVTGVVARYLSANPTASPSQVSTAVLQGSATGVVSGLKKGTANMMLQSQLACACTA